MSEWTPKPRRDSQLQTLQLTGEEGFLLSQVDGSTSIKNLVHVTGLPEGRVREILDKLVGAGAVEGDGEERASLSARLESQPVQDAGRSRRDGAARGTMRDDDGDGDDDDYGGDDSDEGEAEDEGGTAAEDEAENKATNANARRLYHEALAKLEPGLRQAMAQAADEPELTALCFDALPAVIQGVLENARAGFSHARLIARHHQTPQGLEFVMGRPEFFRDGQTQRLLLQNTMLQEPQLKRLLHPRRMAEIYKVTISREIPERNRQKARQVLRSKWATCEAEERAGLVLQTEGRCLAQLTGLPFDSRTTSMLCLKTYASNLLIQNLARFGATPPPVLAHLLKQNAVRRQPMLRNLVLQHPNCPTDAKRKT